MRSGIKRVRVTTLARELLTAYRTQLTEEGVPTVMLGIARRVAKYEIFLDGILVLPKEMDFESLKRKYKSGVGKMLKWFQRYAFAQEDSVRISSLLAKWGFLAALDDYHLLARDGYPTVDLKEVYSEVFYE